MLALSYFAGNWSACVESRLGNMLFITDQRDTDGFIWQTAWLLAASTAKRPSSGEHLAGRQNQFRVQFFREGVYLVQLFIRSSA